MTTKTHFETGAITSFGLGGIYFALKTGKVYEGLDHTTLMTLLNSVMIYAGFTIGAIYPDISDFATPVGEDLGWDQKFQDRGITHTLLNVIGLGIWLLPVFIVPFFSNIEMEWLLILVASIAAGCIHHMILDTLTPDGIAWFYPITKKHISIPLIRGPKSEFIFRILYLVVMIILSVHWNAWNL